jgi:hypothetical protein
MSTTSSRSMGKRRNVEAVLPQPKLMTSTLLASGFSAIDE